MTIADEVAGTRATASPRLCGAAWAQIAAWYRNRGPYASAPVLVANSLQQVIGDEPKAAGAHSEDLAGALAAEGLLERDETGAWVLSARGKWRAMTEADGDDWVTSSESDAPMVARWMRHVRIRELRQLAEVGATSDEPVRALAYAAEACTRSARGTLTVLTALIGRVDPGPAAALLARAAPPTLEDEPLTAADAVAVALGVLDPPTA